MPAEGWMEKIPSVSRIEKEIHVDPSEEAERLARSWGYLPYMVERYLRILGSEAFKLLRTMDDPGSLRPVVRCNSLRIGCGELASRLSSMGFRLRPVEWAPHAFEILEAPEAPAPGAVHEFLKGYYYLHRDPAPLIPVLLLALERGEELLDTCSAPGGKATYAAQLMGDEGLVLAGDISLNRLRGLVSNVLRLGLASVVVRRWDARLLHKMLGRRFPKILVDAPCSAEGYIMLDPGRKRRTGERDLALLVRRQIEILGSSISTLEPGGLLVYTVCSIAPEEGEYVVSRILDAFGEEVEILSAPGTWDRGVEIDWIEGVSGEVVKCLRTWPHRHGMGGSFACLLRRL